MPLFPSRSWAFLGVACLVVLAACKPPEAPPGEWQPDSTTDSQARLEGLRINDFGPKAIVVRADGQEGERVDIWVSADRDLEGLDASLWLDDQPLANRAVSGSTVTGSVPSALTRKPGAHALEIRIADRGGAVIHSDPVTFNVE